MEKKTGLKFKFGVCSYWTKPSKGIISPSGRRVVLKSVKKFGLLYTLEEWIDIFIEEANE